MVPDEVGPLETRFVTSAEAARQLGYTIQHARRLINSGRLQGVKIGRDWMVLKSSVEALAAGSENLSLPFEGGPKR